MEWFSGSIPEAVNEAKRNNKLFLVYIEGSDDMSKTMTITYDNPTISQKLSSGKVVALKLTAYSMPYNQFCAIYPVLVIPSSYFIGANGAPIEIITGDLTPIDFSGKLDHIFEIYEKGLSKPVTPPTEASTSTAEAASTSSEASVILPSASIASSTSGSNDPIQEKVERAKALIEAQRQSKSLEEQEQEKRREVDRRSVGKALQQAEKTKADNELKEWVKNRAKEKEEDRLAREKVKAMIAQDRAERAARYQQTKEAEQAEKERLAHIREAQQEAARASAMNSNEARIQFRLPDGASTNHIFSADSTLEQARVFVREQVRPPFSNFTLCTTFPRRHFTEQNYPETMRDLQLAPSAVLLILPGQAVSNTNQGAGFLSNLFWMLISPFTAIWRLLTSFFPGAPSEPSPPNEVPPTAQPSTSKSNETDSNSHSEQSVRRREPKFYKREGNIFRLNNQSDDDENNTYNGNSTQQM